uniref:FERM domain-containing protein n=1 Tax=Hucho hucho TaxID=62062 RepID=A0A4W5QD71_9TELE
TGIETDGSAVCTLVPVCVIPPPVVSQGPKSSFITPEKRAKLRSNPVKVRFAEEVEVNSHSQGNSLLFLPNVLKVYLENGQTKAFKFEPNTTVKDIVMTLKEKLSLSRIEHFSLVLEQKYSISKLLLLHEEERIQQVVHQKEVHDYRCLFRVCFIPREPEHLLQDDPTAFQYLYLQVGVCVRRGGCMTWSTADHIPSIRTVQLIIFPLLYRKSWGIENFISSTLLRNMREKDLRKAIGYHMKKSQSQEPKQKVLSANHAKINYLEELCDLKSFGGKTFSATMMLQDRESMVTLLVGSRYGVSQVVNHKLSILTTLTEFSSITRIELLPESDRVSLVKIYLQDIKPITLLLESVAAKELSCLVAGYCRALVDPSLIIFPWTQDAKQHRVSAEEGWERKGEEERGGGERKGEEERGEHPSVSEEASDSCRTDSRFMTSISSDSLDALEEDDLIACSSSLPHPPFRLTVEPPHPHPQGGASSPQGGAGEWRGEGGEGGSGEEERRKNNEGSGQEVFSVSGRPRSSSSSLMDCVFTFEQSDARHYYNICPNVTPDSTRSLSHPHPETEEVEGGGEEEEQAALLTLEPVPILQPPPGFGDSSSDEEFFDARDRFASPEDPTSGTVSRGVSGLLLYCKGETNEGGGGREMFSRLSKKRSKKRRSFMQTDFTSTYPDRAQNRTESSDDSQQLSLDPEPSEQSQNPCPTVSSLSHTEGEASQLESKPILAELHRSSRSRRQSMETEPDVMESKSVTALVTAASLSISAVCCRVEPDGKESTDRRGDGEEVEGEMEEEEGGREAGAGPFTCHMFLTEIKEEDGQRGEETGEEGESDREERQPSIISEGPPSVRGSQFSHITYNRLPPPALLTGHNRAKPLGLHITGEDPEPAPLFISLPGNPHPLWGGKPQQEPLSGDHHSPPASQPSSSALALPLTTSPPLSSFLSSSPPSSPPSSLLSPSFPSSVLPPSSSMELSPLLSPLLSPSNCFLSQSSLHDDISRLRHRRFPPPPAGFQTIRSDVDELLTLLQGGRMGGRGGRHPRETCATHFSENKRLLHGEARRLMAGCQKVVRVGQTSDEMLFSLSDSFRTLVVMAGMCLWFSGCDRCDRRNAEALAGLADVARTYREFVLAAERASGRRSCHDLSTKLLAKQCTALTASVFCLTQLFRTLTAL